jgi:hypothetical protein
MLMDQTVTIQAYTAGCEFVITCLHDPMKRDAARITPRAGLRAKYAQWASGD